MRMEFASIVLHLELLELLEIKFFPEIFRLSKMVFGIEPYDFDNVRFHARDIDRARCINSLSSACTELTF